MTSSALDAMRRAATVHCTRDELIVALQEGRTLSTPLAWFPRLLNASTVQRDTYELMGNGEGIHWPGVDEDVSIVGLLAGQPSWEYRNRSTR